MVIKSVLPNRNLKRELTSVVQNMIDKTDYRDINLFMSLLDKILTLDPSKRPPVEQLLNHTFINPQSSTKESKD